MTQNKKIWQVGNTKVTQVTEIEFVLEPEIVYAKLDADLVSKHASWLKPNFINDDGNLVLPIHTFVIESSGKTILIDTGFGNDRTIPQGIGKLNTNYLSDLEAIAKRENIDYVMYTHLHIDHVGWNTMLVDGDWVPTFPNAKYLFTRQDYDYIMRYELEAEDTGVAIRYGIQPIVEAGLYELIDHDFALDEEVSLEPSPGHMPGHACVKIESKGEVAVITGDMAHNPIQLAEPTLASHADRQPDQAIRTRREFVDRYADTNVLVLGSHFARAGYIRKEGDSCRLECD